jgi:hypothetical protein
VTVWRAPLEAAMKIIPLALMGISLAIAAQALGDAPKSHSRAALHAAATDIPAIVDMSYADPLTWHSLPRTVEIEVRPRNIGPSCFMLNNGPEACTPLIVALR